MLAKKKTRNKQGESKKLSPTLQLERIVFAYAYSKVNS
jgi:hypothetical protein